MLKPKEMEIVNRALDCYAHAVNEDFDKLRQTGELTKSKYAIDALTTYYRKYEYDLTKTEKNAIDKMLNTFIDGK